MNFSLSTKICNTIVTALSSGILFAQAPPQESSDKVAFKSEIVKQSVDLNAYPDVIHPKNYAEVIPQVYALKSTPISIVLRIGQEFSISSLRIQAEDKDQNILGTLTAYNTQLKPGAYKISGPRKITGATSGTGELLITPPLSTSLITDRPIPELRIVVTVLE